MSRRLLQRGRYPKGPNSEQITNTNSQFPQTTTAPYPVPSEVAFYSTSQQPQTGQNSWSTLPYPNSSNYQQNQVSNQPVPESSGVWSGGHVYPVPTQPSTHDPWHWKVEGDETPCGTNYQQPILTNQSEQWQQTSYSQMDNQNYSHQPPGSFNAPIHQGYQQTAEYQTANNNANSVSQIPSLPAWENGGLNITQPEQLPWTYGTPQYYEPSQCPVLDYTQNSNSTPTNISSWPVSSNAVIPAQDAYVHNYLSNETENVNALGSVDQPESHFSYLEQKDACTAGLGDFEKVSKPSTDINSSKQSDDNLKDSTSETEHGNSTLSAFFQNTEPDESASNSEHDQILSAEIKSARESPSLEENVVNLGVSENENISLPAKEVDHNEEVDDGRNQENNFIQEEKFPCLGPEEESKCNSESPLSLPEEPINQEVPEPPGKDLSNSKMLILQTSIKQDYNAVSMDDPPNQQIPAESNKSRSTSSERERIVIRPREESPFKPPRLNNAKGTVVQQELPPIQNPVESVQSKGKIVTQEVNLETFPDNLERPSDYEELRKQSPLYVSHKHLRNELNSSPSSLLCDNLDIPCVTLAPAAPPLHSSAKSDLSESSNDSKLDNISSVQSNTSPFILNESSINSSAGLPELDASEKCNSYHPVIKSSNTKVSKPSNSSQSKSDADMSTTAKDINLDHVENQQPLYLTDSKVNGSTSAVMRNSESPKKKTQGLDPSDSLMIDNSRKYPEFSPDTSNLKIDPRYASSYIESSRQRFADQKNPSFDERHYYSDRERSRPSSRSSMAERVDNYSRSSESLRMKVPNLETSENCVDDVRRNPDFPQDANSSRGDPRYASSYAGNNRQRFAEQKYPTFDDPRYYSDRERSRPSSRSSLGERQDDRMFQTRPQDYAYQAGGDQRQFPTEYPRPSSRLSESDVKGSSRRQYGYYQQPYPYAGGYPRSDYYQRSADYRGYEYNPYQCDPYYAQYYDAYRQAYNTNFNYNYGYYDELYGKDPSYRQLREEQIRQYYAKYGYDADYERSSVQSGRSSANELSKEIVTSQYPEQDIDSNESELSTYNLRQNYSYDGQNEASLSTADQTSTPSARLTPAKFPYAHPIARFSPGGLFISMVPNQMSASLTTPITIHSLQVIMENEESFQELKIHQGPLVRGLTHKNDVIEFCSNKIKSLKQKDDVVDRDSFILLWELMVLLLRQNGSVAGSDIAELLLKDHDVLHPANVSLKHVIETPQGEHSPADVNDSSSQSHAGDTSSPDEGIVVLNDKSSNNNNVTVDLEKLTHKFREFLLFGHKKDALEWAMKHGLWGHALFLASKMDLRTYANVMTRFANSLALNDPLQTLYQLMSGRQPSSVTSVADKKWGDWRPHLAMILSNPSAHPDVDSKSITTLGDTLARQGCLPAAHFCYIMAQVEFGTYEQKNSKLVLLSADHRLSFEEFATNEAIQCTEIYEYAQSLANPGYMLAHLQVYKFLYALRLVEHGFLEEALHYCEVIAGNLQAHPSLFQLDFILEVYKLATQLKYHDPHFLRGQGELEEQEDPDWLKSLSALVQNYNTILQADNSQSYFEPQPEAVQNINSSSSQFPSLNDNMPEQNISNFPVESNRNNSMQMNYYQSNGGWNQQPSALQNASNLSNSQQDNMSYYQRDRQSNQGSFQMESSIPSHEENDTTDVPSSPVTQTPPFDYYSGGTQQGQDRKSIYEPVSNYTSNSTVRERRDSAMSSGSRYSGGSLSVNKSSNKENQKSEIKKDKPTTQAGKTWLGGIFSRLMPKAPNQMILPDDKNPTIVWDDTKNCWVNKDSNEEDESVAPLAPPTDVELLESKSSEKVFQSPPGSSVPSLATSPTVNRFQRPKTRVMRQNYVDVLNTSGATTKNIVPPEALFPTTPFEQTGSPQMFIPNSVPTAAENYAEFDSGSHASFSTSQSKPEEQSQTHAAPLMLDPAEFDSRKSSLGSQRLTLGRTGRRTYPT